MQPVPAISSAGKQRPRPDGQMNCGCYESQGAALFRFRPAMRSRCGNNPAGAQPSRSFNAVR